MKKFFWTILFFVTWASASCVVKSLALEGFAPEVEKDWASMVGESCEDLEYRLQEMVDELSENGFPFASVSHQVDSLGNATVKLSRGSAWVWADAENVEVSKTQKQTFARLSGLTSGGPVRLSDLERAERKLVNSGYFESTAKPKLYRDPVRNRIVPTFSMRDLSINSFEGLLSYASGEDGGWAGNLNLSLYNMRGTGRDLHVSGETGEWERSIAASYKEPWLFGTGWNGIVRGSFEEDSSYRSALLEAGLSRSVGFYFEFAVLGGIGDDRWTYTLETSFKNEDRIVLPRHGMSLNGTFRVIKDRTDSSHAFTTDLHANGRFYTPLTETFVLQFSFFVGTLLPTDRNFDRQDLFTLGGMENLKGYRPGFFRTRAYGITELDLQWRVIEMTAFHLFLEPALYRAQSPEHGWADTYSYGIGISQNRGYWNFSLYYALHSGTDPLDGLLHFGVKALF